VKKIKKSYMNPSNIISEKITLGGVLKYLSSMRFKKLPKDVDDKRLKNKLKDMNKNVDEINALLKKMYGAKGNIEKYTMKDLKGEK
tara:strand:+ start:39 stop:296 length:258 start_codon:yes stop_codon:yes gene_type:complete